MQRIAFIMNPISGTGQKQTVWRYISENFGNLTGVETTMYTTQYAGDGCERAKQFAAEGYDAVVAIGGDGTVNEIASGLLHSNTALGIVPMGSGNGLARHLRIPLNYKKALDIVTNFRMQTIDGARINNKTFFCTAGIGFDALISYMFNKSGKRGIQKYVEISATQFIQYSSQDYTLYIDGKKCERKAFLITFANASQWGNNAYVAPQADASDGLLDVVVWKSFPQVAAPFMLPRLFNKSLHKSPYVETFRGRHILVERSKNTDVAHFDGEACVMGKTLYVHVLPDALKVLVSKDTRR